MNDIKIVTLFKLSSSYSIMAEGVGRVVDSENGSFHSQITRRLPRKATQGRRGCVTSADKSWVTT